MGTFLAALGGGAIIQIFIQILVLISSGFLYLAGSILSWVCSDNFISLPYTHGPIIDDTWALTRDLTNMLFVVVLVFIGLATALRIRDYEAKKTLPVLIIIALLINFTPVICGFIVDATNIVMNFFIKNASAGEIIAVQLSSYYNSVKSDILGISFFNPLEHIKIFIRAAIVSFFNIIAGFILLAFAFIFIFRYIAIWMLVILSPFAFFSYILPATRKIWTMWWNQFIQWTFIGVTGSFFLYLGMFTIKTVAEHSKELGHVGANWLLDFTGVSELLNGTLSLGIGLAFLAAAFFMGLSSGAMGGNQIIGWAKAGGKAAGSWAGRTTWREAQQRLRLPETAERIGRRTAGMPVFGGMIGNPLLRYAERYRGGVEEAEKKFANWSSENIAAQLNRLPERDYVAALKIIAQRGDFGLVQRAGYPVNNNMIMRGLEIAQRYRKERDIVKFLPQYAGQVASVQAEAARLNITPEEVVARWIKQEDIPKLDRDIFNNPGVTRAMIYQFGPEKWAQLRHQSSEVINIMQTALENEYHNNPDALIARNYPLLRYTHSNAARAFWRPVGNINDIERRRQGQPPPPPPPGIPHS